MRRFHVWMAAGGLAALASFPGVLRAQGFSVNEHSTCAMGRAGTAVASPCDDASAIVFNPAGLASMPKGQTKISVGGTFIAPNGAFTQDFTGFKSDLKSRVFPVPAVYLAHGVTDKFAAGVGLFAPYGLETDWPEDAIGRFASYNSVIRNIYVQPTVAYKLGEYIQIGAGFDIQFAHLQLKQHLDLSEQNTTTPGVTFANLGIPAGTDFADAKVTGNGTGVGYHVGVLLKLEDVFSIGARYLSRQKISKINGTAEFSQIATGLRVTPGSPFALPPSQGGLGLPVNSSIDTLVLAPQFQSGGSLVTQDGNTGIRLPEQFNIGIAVRPIEKLQVLAEYNTQNWKVWDVIALDFELLPTEVLPQNFKRTHTWRFGAEYAVTEGTALRAGYLTHTAAAPKQTVTPTLPEGPRAEFTVGFGTRLSRGLHADVAYQYIDQADRRGRSGSPGSANDGLYTFKAHLFGATLTYTF
jgi:long-chain fatty acid transport protein